MGKRERLRVELYIRLREAERGTIDRVAQREEVVAGVRGWLVIPLQVRERDEDRQDVVRSLLRDLRGEDGLRVRVEVVRVQLRRVHARGEQRSEAAAVEGAGA